MLKDFLNNKEIPFIPPLFHENSFITDFKENAERFDSFFAKQCSIIRSDSEIPTSLKFYTDNCLFTVSFLLEDVGKIIQNLNPNKAHGHYNISIRMPKICDSTIYKPLEIIFKEALNTGLFPSEWKKGTIVPIHKKGDKQVLKNYRLVSLPLICGEIFKRLIFNEMFSFLLKNLVSSLGILALISYYPLHMKSFTHLMKNLKLEGSSYIFHIYSYISRYGTKD